MSYIKFEARHLADDRWLDAGGDAFTLHAWALSYCNESGTDGLISTRMTKRTALPLDPEDVPAAVKSLLDLGFWQIDGDGYRIVDYLAHGLPADEQAKTRAKWAADKRRQRLHQIGNHSLCTERSCAAVRGGLSAGGQVELSTEDKWTTRPDQTRLDPTLREGVVGSGVVEPPDGPGGPPGADADDGWRPVTGLAASRRNAGRLCDCDAPAWDEPGPDAECIRCGGDRP